MENLNSAQDFNTEMYLILQDRLKSEVPELKYIEQNLGQYLDENYRASVSFPALLIDFTNTTFTGLSGNIQLGNATINLVLLFEAFSQSYDKAPEQVKRKALEYYDLEAKIHKALQGWSPDFCSPLVRISTKSQNRHDKAVRIREIDYTTEYEDWSAENEEKSAEFSFSFVGSVQQIEPLDENTN